MKNNQLITVSVVVDAPLEKVWEMFTEPEHITKWAFASDDWEAPFAENDLRELQQQGWQAILENFKKYVEIKT